MPTSSKTINPNDVPATPPPTPPVDTAGVVSDSDPGVAFLTLDETDVLVVRASRSGKRIHELQIDKQTGAITVTFGGRAYPGSTLSEGILADFLDYSNKLAYVKYGHISE